MANLFSQFIYELYDHIALILTTNKDPDEWEKFFGEPIFNTAILESLLHQSEVISYRDDPSHRMKYG